MSISHQSQIYMRKQIFCWSEFHRLSWPPSSAKFLISTYPLAVSEGNSILRRALPRHLLPGNSPLNWARQKHPAQIRAPPPSRPINVSFKDHAWDAVHFFRSKFGKLAHPWEILQSLCNSLKWSLKALLIDQLKLFPQKVDVFPVCLLINWKWTRPSKQCKSPGQYLEKNFFWRGDAKWINYSAVLVGNWWYWVSMGR